LWRYVREGRVCGPVTAADLKLLADAGMLQPTDQVCKEGAARWVPAASVRGLFDGGRSRFFEGWGLAVAIIGGVAVLLLATILIIAFINHRAGEKKDDSVFNSPPVQPERKDGARPPKHLRAALHEMRAARDELRGAEHDSGGRLEEASHALTEAIDQTERALKAAGVDVRVEPPPRETYKEYPNHPHLRRALTEILQAKIEIKEAGHDLFGEHRDRTLRALESAAEKVEAAMKFAKD
jgi:hypothetical protein